MELQHTNQGYEAELRRVEKLFKYMVGHVSDMIQGALLASGEGSVSIAQNVIQSDERVDRLEIDLDELCLSILARRQPMGVDLRLISMVLKSDADLERMGDLAASIAKRLIRISEVESFKIPRGVDRMGRVVLTQLQMVSKAFFERDSKLARAVMDMDDEVDALYISLVEKIAARLDQEKYDTQGLVHLQIIAKWFERMGDHCTNIAEQVIFLVDGRDVRHPKKFA